ncbi:alkaline phosphatase-like protein [Lophiostoma macrostomum CBS 122681]|uniref:GPI ethanolamine phosphate transferase 2 n=1 Tax=Lophiostoma macrostomum CBS 122681 TaxID=1314788 RepID=A0A6A6T020_9PLEO|nr:alkaline phosphatase-like protein [Lophiostoma macrostomum CBS 122681]
MSVSAKVPQWPYLTIANLLIPVAVLVFATGFFPYKPFMPGLATYEEADMPDSLGQAQPPAIFDKVVFMVVDALRSDFVFGEESGMEYVQSLIRSGAALPFTAHATSPTITMPRVKAITTGSIPSFLDVILNFAESDTSSTLATQDTWLAQLKAKEGGKLVMYGDDTWLKLFPGFFARADGTSSFFVSDFTEVDNNVTRHVPEELLNSDWNALIMHYLGLDHIGHKTGPKGPEMIPKQKEMDGIVRQIFEAIENEDHLENTLFVLCGDHGMNEGGNHGGSSPGETSPALVFMSPRLQNVFGANRESPTKASGEFEYYKKVEQSDIVPTLAGLLGFPVPRNNLGVFIADFLPLWEQDYDRLRLLQQNVNQVQKIVEATYPKYQWGASVGESIDCDGDLTVGQHLACRWQSIVKAASDATSKDFAHVTRSYYEFLYDAQAIMSTTASNYDVSKLFLGSSLAFASLVMAWCSLDKFGPITATGIFYTLTLALYGVLMFASSYVEEEHNFWYWVTSGWFCYLFISSSRKEWLPWFIFHPAVTLLILHRIIRRWNQTGQKYAGADDIVHSPLLCGSSSILLWSLVGAAYMDVTIRISRHVGRSISSADEDKQRKGGAGQDDNDADFESTDVNRFIGTLATLPLGATAFVFKLAFTSHDAPELTQGISPGLLAWVDALDLVGMARMVFGGLGVSLSWLVFAEWRRARNRKRTVAGNGDLALTTFDLLTLLLLTQTKAQNIPLYLLFRLQTFFLSLLSLSPTSLSLTTTLLSQTAFFALGNSNAISSISLSNSYNGVASYNISAVGLLLFLSNWAGPVYWALAGTVLLGAHGGVGGERRGFDTSELDERDWVVQERERLVGIREREVEEEGRRGEWGVWRQWVALATMGVAGGLVGVMAACTVLRTHLFVWSVFSPKFLFAVAWSVAHHLGVVVGLGSLVWWVGMW